MCELYALLVGYFEFISRTALAYSSVAHADSDLIDLKSQLPPGIGVMISKNRKDPSPLGLIVPVDFRARK
jgi:hypothetical protein